MLPVADEDNPPGQSDEDEDPNARGGGRGVDVHDDLPSLWTSTTTSAITR